MEKKKYYVSLASHEISQTRYHNNDDFVIYATEGEVRELRNTLNRMYRGDMDSYWRAHIPIVKYHHDTGNETYDREITEVFQMLYELGDEQTKDYIKSTGVLSDMHM